MVISNNPEPPTESFEQLLNDTIGTLSELASRNSATYLDYTGTRLEPVVHDVMVEKAIGSCFENTIELISGQKFPDIVANRFYGVEVKTTKQPHWTTTGNSVLESTRVESVERIYLLFGKMNIPIEFKFRPYEKCLSEVVVTHSPRYLINMQLDEGETIFDKIGIDYDRLRNEDNPIRPIIDYYKAQLREGDELWWIDQGESSEKEIVSTNISIRLWSNLSQEGKADYSAKAMILFPELFGRSSHKYTRLATWLVSQGIATPSLRDTFSAGGQVEISFDGITYENVPRVFKNLFDNLDIIRQIFSTIPKSDIEYYWESAITEDNKIQKWIELVTHYSIESLSDTQINIREILNHRLQ